MAAIPIDKVAAIVDEDVVLESEVTQRIADLQFQYRNRPNTLPSDDILRTQVLEQLIVQRIQLSQAERGGVKIDDNSLNGSLTEIAQQNGMTLAEFRNKLETEKAGSYNQVREQIRQEMITIASVIAVSVNVFILPNKTLITFWPHHRVKVP